MNQLNMNSMYIPAFDLTAEINELKPKLMAAIEGVLDRGAFIMGENVRALENEVADWLDVRHAVAMNSGTDALVIALLAAGIGEGDEVITSPFTFFATAEAISRIGAIPVFADVEPSTFNLDSEQVRAKITPRTKAILPVHLFGHPANLTALGAIAEEYGLSLIEDAAQAFGARWKDRKIGAFGDAGCFSFFPTKNLGAYGDGGMLVTNRDNLAEQARMLRAHGSKQKYRNELIGFNSRLDELQAAILRVKLPYLTEWNESRRTVAKRYHTLLNEMGTEASRRDLLLPLEQPAAYHVFHQYTLRVLHHRRDELKSKLAEAGISSTVYYPLPVHRLPVYEHLGIHLPVAESLAEEVLSIPMWPQLEESDQVYIAEQIIQALG